MPTSSAPNGWSWTKLTDLSRLETGHTPSRQKPEYWDGDIPWIGIRDATANHGRTLLDTVQHVTQKGIDNSSARVLPANTVCLSRTASVGYVVVMGREMATSQDFVNWVCDESKLDYRFLKYILLAENQSFSRFSHGTTHQTIYFPEVKALHVCVPSVSEQRAIADVLTSLDDKIEQNRRTGQVLERLAHATFKAWFVDFEPVKAKAAGAAESPGTPAQVFAALPERLVESPIGPVPEGWSLASLPQLAMFLNGLALQKYPARGDGSDLPVIKIAELRKGSSENADAANSDVPAQFVVNDGDLLFSWSGTLEVQRWFGGKGALNQHLFKVTPSRHPLWYVHHAILQHLPEFRAIASSKATTMGHIQRKHLDAAMVVVPAEPVLRAADELISPIYALAAGLRIENRVLAALRDYLLPRLLTGQVRVQVAVRTDAP
jgi:type I restriction enzyme S subunit